LYAPGVFYCKDAFEGLDTMEKLVDDQQRQPFMETHFANAYAEMGKPQKAKAAVKNRLTAALAPAAKLPAPPFWGARTISEMPTEMVLQYLYKPELFRLSWGAKNAHGEEWEKLSTEFEARLASMSKAAIKNNWLKPQAVYGYFPANSQADSLLIYDPAAYAQSGQKTEIARFSFPRQEGGEFLCISDYYRPLESGEVDVVALQVVTVGEAATTHFDSLQNSDQYSEAYYFHGLAVQAAEATANYVNQHIRRELSLGEKQGKRYSWGYPACPDLADHQVVVKLLPDAINKLGMTLTSAYQWVPEQSTAAIFAHHPDAKYFNVAGGQVNES
jgi:5-methyltetrahydrofolate--homocysteine methyltransferase